MCTFEVSRTEWNVKVFRFNFAVKSENCYKQIWACYFSYLLIMEIEIYIRRNQGAKIRNIISKKNNH